MDCQQLDQPKKRHRPQCERSKLPCAISGFVRWLHGRDIGHDCILDIIPVERICKLVEALDVIVPIVDLRILRY